MKGNKHTSTGRGKRVDEQLRWSLGVLSSALASKPLFHMAL
jgi:hypothetical protein